MKPEIHLPTNDLARIRIVLNAEPKKVNYF